MLIERAELCALIPHAGTMCLLDGVESWDDQSIVCITSTHLSPDNPLRTGGHLGVIHGTEYGAQAMAVHGGVLARLKGESMVSGYLAALRNVRWYVDFLDCVPGPMRISAKQLLRSGGNMMYEFDLRAEGKLLVSGRATVMTGEQGAT